MTGTLSNLHANAGQECSNPTCPPSAGNQGQSDQGDWVGVRRALPAIGFAGVCAAASLTELSADEGQVFCPYRLLTGGWCPGCGGTRALKALVRGDIRDSLVMNPWTLVLFVQALVVSVAMLAMPARTVTWIRSNSVAIAATNLVIGLGFWGLRLLAGVIPLPFT